MTDRRSGPRRERGNLLILVILLIIPLASLGGSLLSLGGRNLAEQDAARMRSMALLRAESGIDAGLAQLMDNATNVGTIQENEAGGALYRVTIDPLVSDTLDNDGDGLVDEEDEDQYYRLTSTGAMNALDFAADGTPVTQAGAKAYAKRVRAIGRKLEELPSFPFAVYLGDPLAEIQLNGNAFAIDGNDTNVDGSAGSGGDAPGIATTGDPADIEAQLSAQQTDNITGDPPIGNVVPIDLQYYIDLYKGAADIKFPASTTFSGELGNLDEGDIKITHAIGTLDISSGCTGAGLLLVEGNLEITGDFEYSGIIIVTGQVIFRGGGGTKTIFGSCLAGGDVLETANNNSESLEVSGTVDIIYSTEVQDKVSQAVATFTLFGWQEL